MAQNTDEDTDEKPLDPAVERVRRKLIRFMVINVTILFGAVMVVVAALVYKSLTAKPSLEQTAGEVAPPLGESYNADIAVPAGARIVSQSLSGDRLSLQVELPGGTSQFVIYDLRQRQIVARLALKGE